MTKSSSLILLFLLFAVCNIGYAQNIGDMYPSARKAIEDGVELHDKEDYKGAIEKFLSVNENDSFYTNAQYELSQSYLANKDYEKAREVALRGVKMETELNRKFLTMYANALEELDKFDSAIIIYNQLAKAYPNYYNPHYEKAVSYKKRKEWDKAVAAFSESLKRNVYHSASHLWIGLIAADAKQPAIALMALQMYCMLNNEGSNVPDVITFMEKVATNEYTPETEVSNDVFPKDELLEELNAVLLSKGALSKKYKSKLKIDYNINKQLQVLMEKLPDNPKSNDWLINLYMNFYKELWNNNHFEGSVLESFVSIKVDKVQKEIKANQKKIDDFSNWATPYLNKIRNEKTIMWNGKEEKVTHWFRNGDVYAIGNEDANAKNYGYWVFYDIDGGNKTAEGNYENDLKVGKWTYYYLNGKIKTIENYTAGKLNGEFLSYHENGAPFQKYNYVNSLVEGEGVVSYPNNALKAKINFKNDKAIGVRYNYNNKGLLSFAGELKDGIYEGWYKSYHDNGKVDMECQTVKDELHGKVTYYYANGKVKSTGAFNNGKRTGVWKWLFEDGTTDTEGEYNATGSETGLWKYYFENGNLKTEENYENGVKRGTIRKYDGEGKIYGEFTFKNGNIDSYKYYDKSSKVIAEAKTSGGKLKYVNYNEYRNKISEGQIINGKDAGLWKYYYANGQLESESNLENGSRQGLTKGYYKNGKLEYESFYDKGNLKGFYKGYFINGKLKVTAYYDEEGNRTGSWAYYNMSGKPDSKYFYIDGDIVGLSGQYYNDGVLAYYDEYRYGFFNNTHEADTTGKIYNITKLEYGNGEYVNYTMVMKPEYQGKYKAGKKEGKFTTWNGGGKIINEAYYQYGKLNGNSKALYENGKTKKAGIYKDGEQDSIWNYYEEDGKLEIIETFKNGEQNGVYKSFYDNGKVEVERFHKDGERHGDYKRYAPDGMLVLWIKYENGVVKSYSYLDNAGNIRPFIELQNETGDIKTYYPNGQLAVSFKLDRGLFQGTYEAYSPSGKLISLSTYVDGESEGIDKEFYVNGNLKQELNYVSDEVHGLGTYYHENGKIKREVPYHYGYKHGIVKEYDNTGKVIKQTKYIYDKVYE